MQVRDAYQRKGWVMMKLSDISQCAHDGYLESVRAQESEGCRMWGRLDVNKVAGNFHFAAGRSFQQGSVHIHDMSPFEGKVLDFAHTIKRLSFGPQYPGMRNPLDGAKSSVVVAEPKADKTKAPVGNDRVGGSGAATTNGSSGARTGMFQYFLKVDAAA